MLELEAKGSGKVLVIGHRGALGYVPENTMPSFAKGVECGADLIELDVHLTADDAIVVIHDDDVSRTTDGRGVVRGMTLAEIRGLDAGSRFDPKYRGERIPTLDEVLDWAKGRVQLVVEIKGGPLPAPGIEERVVQALRDHRMVDAVMAISFHHPAVKRLKGLEPALATGILYSGLLVDTVGAARATGTESVRPQWNYWTRELVDEVHAAGLLASSWVANDEPRMEYLVGMGVDSIGCDYPDRLRHYLDRVGRGWR
jgi:glycerophosphoryl diester phosphodiesterase